jgi:hypothetical protein
MGSNPSRMRYYVMFPHWMSVMFSWANHICGSAMLFMSLDPIVSLFLWGFISTEYREVVPTTVPPKKCRKVVSHTAKFSFFTICSEEEQKDTATTTTSPQAPSIQQKKVNKATKKHKDSFCTPSSHVSLLFEQPQPQQVHDRLPQTEQHDVSNKTSNSLRCKFNKHFSLSLGNSMQWRPFLPKEVGLI